LADFVHTWPIANWLCISLYYRCAWLYPLVAPIHAILLSLPYTTCLPCFRALVLNSRESRLFGSSLNLADFFHTWPITNWLCISLYYRCAWLYPLVAPSHAILLTTAPLHYLLLGGGGRLVSQPRVRIVTTHSLLFTKPITPLTASFDCVFDFWNCCN
jgi:hypothetical protein